LKIRIGDIVIDSMDDPSIHKEQLEKSYKLAYPRYGRLKVYLHEGSNNTVTLKYSDRLLVQVMSYVASKHEGCWITNNVKVVSAFQVDRYKRKKDWLGRWKKD